MSARLTLMQWLSPAFPTGAFAYSHGLERVIAAGDVHDAASMERWLRNILHYGAGWNDGVLLCAALRPSADHQALDHLARALQPSLERLQESAEQGAALARTIAAMTGRPLPPRLLPIALGEAAALLGLAPAEVAQLFLQSFAANLCLIATRHIPLGQTQGQAVLARLQPDIVEIGDRAALAETEDLGSATLAVDLAAMQHETMDVRIFRT